MKTVAFVAFSLLISSVSLSAEKCLNLEGALTPIFNLNNGSSVREVATDLKLSGGKVRAQYMRNVLTRNFVFRETEGVRVKDLYPSIEQKSCRDLTITWPSGAVQIGRIERSSARQITVRFPYSRETYLLISANEIETTREQTVVDDCSSRRRHYRLTTTTRLTWDTDENLISRNETLSASFFHHLTEGLASLPIDLRGPLRSKRATVTPNQLRQMANTEQSFYVARCRKYPNRDAESNPLPSINAPLQ